MTEKTDWFLDYEIKRIAKPDKGVRDKNHTWESGLAKHIFNEKRKLSCLVGEWSAHTGPDAQ